MWLMNSCREARFLFFISPPTHSVFCAFLFTTTAPYRMGMKAFLLLYPRKKILYVHTLFCMRNIFLSPERCTDNEKKFTNIHFIWLLDKVEWMSSKWDESKFKQIARMMEIYAQFSSTLQLNYSTCFEWNYEVEGYWHA